MASPEFISAEMIRRYLLGQLPIADARLIEAKATNDPELRARINAFQDDLANEAERCAVTPPSDLKSKIFDTIAAQESSNRPPILHPLSTLSDYSRWIDGPGMTCPEVIDEVHFIPFGEVGNAESALVWLRNGSPEETHMDFIEKFLILEGTCEIGFNGAIHSLKPGDVLSIPLYTAHTVKVTSSEPCKFILQRIAA